MRWATGVVLGMALVTGCSDDDPAPVFAAPTLSLDDFRQADSTCPVEIAPA